MAQFLRPDSDITQSSFTGGFAEIDEATASDADFAYGANNTAAVLEVGLGNPASTPDPAGTSTVRYRIAKVNNGTLSGSGSTPTVTGEVYQGGTLIQSDSAQTTSGTWTTYSFTFTHGSITDWTDLRLRFTTSTTGGSPANRRGGAVSWAEVEAADPAPNAYVLTADAGAFTETGQAAGLLRGLQVAGDAGAFTLSGQDAALTVGTSLRNLTLTADAAAFTLSGQAAGLQYGRLLAGDFAKFFLPERNMRLWSESFDNAAWTKTQSSITANATTAPDGTLTADALIENTTPSIGHQVTQNITYVTGRTYTASCYFKLYPGPITRYARLQLGGAIVFGTDTYININLAAGTITAPAGSPSDSGITNVGNGWYRAWLTKQYTGTGITTGPSIVTISTGGTSLYTDADGLSGIYIWGAQYEEGSLSDYDPTGAASAASTTFSLGYRLAVTKGTFSLTGNAATLSKNNRLEATTGTFTETGQAAGLQYGRLVAADAGAYAVTGQAAGLVWQRTVVAEAGSFVLAGQDAGSLRNYSIAAEAGGFAVSGQVAGLQRGRVFTADAGAFTETGQDAGFLRGYCVAAEAGSFTLNGQTAAFDYDQITTYKLTAAAGQITVGGRTWASGGWDSSYWGDVGENAQLIRLTFQGISGDAGSFVLTGQTAGLQVGYYLSGGAGTFTETGQAAGLQYGRLLAGDFAKFFLAERNLFQFSEEFDNDWWTKRRITITPNAIAAPDGTLTADKVVEDTSSNTHVLVRSRTWIAGNTYTFSYHAKQAERQSCRLVLPQSAFGGLAVFVHVNLTNGNVNGFANGTYTVTALSDGWYRISLTATAVTTTTGESNLLLGSTAGGTVTNYTGDGTSGIYVWGAQLEESSTATDYDPTGAASATNTAGLLRGAQAAADAGAFTVSGQSAGFNSERYLACGVGSFTAAGQNAALFRGALVTGDAGSFAVSGQSAGLLYGYLLGADASAYALSGQDTAFLRGYCLSAEAGAFTLSGQSVGFNNERYLAAAAGSFSISGQDAGFNSDLFLAASAGAYALSGQDAAFLRGYAITAGAGAFTLSGQSAGFNNERYLACSAGSFAATGQDAGLLRGAQASADAGVYSLSGQDAQLLRGAGLGTEAGSYAVTGQDADLLYTPITGFNLPGDAGSFNATGQNAALLKGLQLTAEASAFVVSGQSAGFNNERYLACGAAAFSVTGQDALLQRDAALAASVGSYTITGVEAALTYTPLARRRFVLIF